VSSVELKGFKGLRSLDSLVKESQIVKPSVDQISELKVESLIVGEYQPRKHMDDVFLNELADSIRVQGIIQPLIVRKVHQQDQYEIIAGERRWCAAKIVGLEYVPAIIKDIEDNIALAFALIENIQRENLTPLEEAMAFARFRDEFFMTHDQIAHRVGRSRVSVTNTLRLLSLSEDVRKLLEDGRLSRGHALVILGLEPDQQTVIAEEVVAKQLNVRDAEKLVQFIKAGRKEKNITTYHEKANYWAESLSAKFSKKVMVKLNAKGRGKVVFYVDSLDDVDWLINNLEDR